MRILMMVPLWKRPEVVKMFLWHLEKTLPNYAELIPYFIISPEDPDFKQLKKLISGYEQYEFKNNTLGQKKNMGLRNAMTIDWDYYMDMGSDGLWTSLLWKMYKTKFDKGVQYFGMKNMYCIDLQLCRALYLCDYHIDTTGKPTSLGVGRCIRRDVVENVMPLWRDDWERGMDGISHFKITKAGYKCDVIDNEKLPVLLDVKTTTNINPMMKLEKESNRVNIKQVYEWFGLDQYHTWSYNHTGNITFEDFREQVLRRVNIYGSQKKAFQSINTTLPEKRYANYNVYKNTQTRKFKK